MPTISKLKTKVFFNSRVDFFNYDRMIIDLTKNEISKIGKKQKEGVTRIYEYLYNDWVVSKDDQELVETCCFSSNCILDKKRLIGICGLLKMHIEIG
jgi:hypothetical protein